MTEKTTLQKLEEERNSLVEVKNPGYKPTTYPPRKELSRDFYGAITGEDYTKFLEFLQEVRDRTPSVYFNDDEISVYYFETIEEWSARTTAEALAVQEWEVKKEAHNAYTAKASELSIAIHREKVHLMQQERLKNAEAASADPDYQKYLALQEVMKAKGYIN